MKQKLLPVIAASLLAFIVTGCASYHSAPLSNLSSEAFMQTSPANEVTVVAKAFNRADCQRYLDRDVLRKGYQPIQLYIQNNTDENYWFSLNRMSLPCASLEEVSDTVHTSTVGRAVGYGVGALFLWPLAIPAIVDGIKSSEANTALDSDFSSKIAKDQLIASRSHLNKIVFVPISEYQRSFHLTMMDQESNQLKSFEVTVLE